MLHTPTHFDVACGKKLKVEIAVEFELEKSHGEGCKMITNILKGCVIENGLFR